MTAKRSLVEVFTAGCPLCDEALKMVERVACPDCEIVVHDLKAGGKAVDRARSIGVHAVPSVAVEGRLAECCVRGALEEGSLRAAGLGQPLD